MSTLPGTFVAWVNRQFTDANGALLANGKVACKAAGTNTNKNSYTDWTLSTPNANPVILDAAGRAAIYLGPGGYDIYIYDSADTLINTVLGVEDVGQTTLDALGALLATGARSVTNGYHVLATDLLITVAGAASPTVINLPAPSDHPQPLTIKNLANVALTLTPAGGTTIDGLSTYTIPAPSSPKFPSALLLPDAANANWIVAAGCFLS